MKKTWKKALVGMVAVSMVFAAGCGKKAENDSGKEVSQEEQAVSDSKVTIEKVLASKDYQPKDYVTLGEYKKIPVDLEVAKEVSQEELDAYIEDELQINADVKKVDRAAENGDRVVINFIGRIDGEEFEGGTSEDYELDLGSGEMIDGFEDGIVGMEPGDTKLLDLTFPEDYDDEEVAGEKVQFEITLNTVNEVNVPEYDDNYIKKYTDCKEKDEYEEQCRQAILDDTNSSAVEEAKSEVWQTVVENATVEGYPESEYDSAYASSVESYQSMSEMFGMDPETYMEDWGLTEEDLKEAAISSIQEQLVMYAIAQKESIALSEEEYEKYLQSYLDDTGMTEDELIDTYGEEELYYVCLYDAVVDFVYENAVITEVEPSEEDDSTYDESDDSTYDESKDSSSDESEEFTWEESTDSSEEE